MRGARGTFALRGKKLRRAVACLLCVVLLSALVACGGPSPARDLTPRTLTWGVGGPLPDAEDFFEALPEGCSARYDGEQPKAVLGTNAVRLIVEDAKGREYKYETSFTLVLDGEPPVMEGVGDLSIYLGESVAYRAGVTVRDNCDGEVVLQVDTSAVHPDRVGSYPVTYTATDRAGNVTRVTVTLYIHEARIDSETLYAAIDSVLAQIVTPGMSTEQKARAVHRYVFDHIAYSSTSDKSDWEREAYSALFVTGRGDCFSYFAACKAFLTRLGIPHMDIQRTPGIVDETHFWHLINIGTEDAPRWYHFDATHLQDYSYSGCLLTDAQIDRYNAERVASDGVTRNYFYAYDRAAYPSSATQQLTPF